MSVLYITADVCMYVYVYTYIICVYLQAHNVFTVMPRGGAKGTFIPGVHGLEGSFRYQKGYYLSVMLS